MSGATVPVPVAVVERMLGELLAVKMAVSEPMGPTTRGVLVETLSGHTNLLGEALSIAEDHAGPDFEALLGEVLEGIQLRGGRLGHAIPGRDGVDAALAALEELGPVLARQPGDREALTQELREAVRGQDGVSWSPRHPDGKLFAAIATQTIPREGDRVTVDGQPYLCGHAEHDLLSCVVPLRFCAGHAYPPVVESDESEKF